MLVGIVEGAADVRPAAGMRLTRGATSLA
jgi:hypothetical protein